MNAISTGSMLDQNRLNSGILKVLEKSYLAIGILKLSTGECLIQAGNSEVASIVSDYISKGTDYDELCKRYINEFIYDEDRIVAQNSLNRSNITDEMRVLDKIHVTLRRKSLGGTFKFIKIEISKIPGPEFYDELLFSFTDMNDQINRDLIQKEQLHKALLEAESASSAKNEFMHNMSHDIRTPLNAIIGYTTIASDHIYEPVSIREYLSKIYNQSQNLLHIVNDILSLGDLDVGSVHLSETTMTMRTLINQIVKSVTPQINDKKLNLHVFLDEKDKAPLVMDSVHLEKVFVNLLSNSAKFTENGGDIYFKISSKPVNKGSKITYTFVVEDTGIGISKEYIKHVFEPYSREQTSTISRKQGVGIGLTIVKNIVDALHGTVSVESELGKGSRFTVVLDLEPAKQAEHTGQISEDIVPAVNAIKGKRILVVDDSKVNRDIASAILESLGAKIELASDGDVAVSMFKAAKPGYYKMILMDIQMPQMDGYEATKCIRGFDKDDAKYIPIIALTADVFEETKRQALGCGMNDFLTKPINVKSLTSLLVRYFTATESK